MINVEIYGKDFCPYCDKAVNLAEGMEHVDFVYKKLDRDFKREELFELFPGARTFPQIKIDGENIGGYSEFFSLHGVK